MVYQKTRVFGIAFIIASNLIKFTTKEILSLYKKVLTPSTFVVFNSSILYLKIIIF